MGVFQNNLMGAAAAAASAGGGDFYDYQITNSVRLNGTSQALNKTWGSAASNDDAKALSFWIKRSGAGGTNSAIGSTTNTKICSSSTGAGAVSDMLEINTGNPAGYSDQFHYYLSSGGANYLKAKWRDPSAWMHIVWIYNSNESTTTDRVKVYINGVSNTINNSTYWDNDGNNGYPSSGADTSFGKTGNKMFIGNYVYDGGGWWGGQMADFIMIDGTAVIGDFGEFKNGVWKPVDPSGLTFGNNGFWLDFKSPSDPGNDASGNNNDFTNIGSIPASATTLDTPTFSATDGNGGNFSTFLSVQEGTSSSLVSAQLSEGNLKFLGANLNAGQPIFSSMMVSSGKWYAEFLCKTYGGANPTCGIGAPYYNSSWTSSYGSGYGSIAQVALGWDGGGNINVAGSLGIGSQSYTSGDILSIAGDLDGNAVYAWKNGTAVNSGSAIGSSPFISGQAYVFGCQTYSSGIWIANYGQDSTFAGETTAGGNADSNGYGNFKYAPPTDFLALCSGNLPTADAVDPAQTDDDYPQKLFSPLIWTGDGTTSRAITGLGFQPDWLWFKNRSSVFSNRLYDTSRGIAGTGGKRIFSNTNTAEVDQTSGQDISAVGTDGFTTGASSANYNNDTNAGGLQAGWFWRANGGTTSSNSNGSITSTVQVDPSGGFSIVNYTGYDSTWDNLSTVGHGLSAAPDCILSKTVDADQWEVYHSAVGAGGGSNASYNSLALNSNIALYTNQTYKTWGGVMPTSTVYTVNGNNANKSGTIQRAYCFANIEGYIKTGSYEGNGNVDGTFVYCGFRPSLVICKAIDSTSDWQMFDDKRVGYNVDNNELQANEADAEVTTDMIDILSNGFKLRIATDPNVAETYVYLAMAENPLQYATAR